MTESRFVVVVVAFLSVLLLSGLSSPHSFSPAFSYKSKTLFSPHASLLYRLGVLFLFSEKNKSFSNVTVSNVYFKNRKRQV